MFLLFTEWDYGGVVIENIIFRRKKSEAHILINSIVNITLNIWQILQYTFELQYLAFYLKYNLFHMNSSGNRVIPEGFSSNKVTGLSSSRD